MIAGRIPAATVVVAVLAVAADVVAVDAPVVQEALAICRPRNMPRRKGLKATMPAGIRAAMIRVRKARIAALSLAVSSHAAPGSAALIIAVLKQRDRAVPLRQLRILMPPKNRSCYPVNPSRNIAANPSRLPLPRLSSRNPATRHPRPRKIHGPLLEQHRHRNLLALAASCPGASLEDFLVGFWPMPALNPKLLRYPRTKTLVSLTTARSPRTEVIRLAMRRLPWNCQPLEVPI
jgi:hypothetical protein